MGVRFLISLVYVERNGGRCGFVGDLNSVRVSVSFLCFLPCVFVCLFMICPFVLAQLANGTGMGG